MRLDSQSDSEVNDDLVAVLADCPKCSDVWYGSVAVEMRDENRLDFQLERRKIEDLSDLEFVL